MVLEITDVPQMFKPVKLRLTEGFLHVFQENPTIYWWLQQQTAFLDLLGSLEMQSSIYVEPNQDCSLFIWKKKKNI